MVLFMACSGEDERAQPRDRGVIIGEDVRLCACCGGWFIDIGESRYRFQRIPEFNDVSLLPEHFPMAVFVSWAPDPEACLGDEIVLESLYELTPE